MEKITKKELLKHHCLSVDEKIIYEKVPIKYIELSDMLMIIDDALTNGFEIKIENHCIYYR